jgi:hypothetical protein
MPYDVGKSKNGSFKYLKDRMWKKNRGWLEKLLAPGGKEVLIKVVALDIPMPVLNYQGGCVRRSIRCCAASVGGAKMANVRPVGCLMTHEYRGCIVVLSINKSVEPNEEQKVLTSGFDQGFTVNTSKQVFRVIW